MIKRRVKITLFLAVAMCGSSQSFAASGCSPPALLVPTGGETVTDSRPAIRWQPAPGVLRYRIKLTSRQPEGAQLVSIDTNISGTEFVPPNPLADSTAVVTFRVASVCPEDPSDALNRESVLRFYVDVRPTCQLTEPPSIQATSDGRRVSWGKAQAADRYEIFAYGTSDGRLIFSTETTATSTKLADGLATPLAIAVRPRCGQVRGAPVYLVD